MKWLNEPNWTGRAAKKAGCCNAHVHRYALLSGKASQKRRMQIQKRPHQVLEEVSLTPYWDRAEGILTLRCTQRSSRSRLKKIWRGENKRKLSSGTLEGSPKMTKQSSWKNGIKGGTSAKLMEPISRKKNKETSPRSTNSAGYNPCGASEISGAEGGHEARRMSSILIHQKGHIKNKWLWLDHIRDPMRLNWRNHRTRQDKQTKGISPERHRLRQESTQMM